MKDVREIHGLLHNLQNLDANKVFRFHMLGKEIQFYLPYAGFDYIQKNILKSADFYEGERLRYVRRTYFFLGGGDDVRCWT